MIRLLAVDDSALMRRLIGEVFAEEEEFEVSFARNGVEALAMLQQLKPDVITLDLEMPRMDGFTFLRILMSRQPRKVWPSSAITRSNTLSQNARPSASRGRKTRPAA